ncbi:MAG: trypsin-like serine protease [Deltaproteobacteria bacterium]|nr:trypsin-like serine protease [Deltaproteobacteria bacterium]
MTNVRPWFLLMPLALASSACALRVTQDSSDLEEERRQLPEASPIVNGAPASNYPEAVLINSQSQSGGSSCSGSVIAPRVVLTAGHCVVGVTSAQIDAPFAGYQQANATKLLTYDWNNTSPYVVPNQHDVALIVTDKPIKLSSYPALAAKPVPQGTSAVNVGRVLNGSVSSSQLFVGQPVTLSYGGSYGFPFAYVSKEIIQSGDSGGPVLLPGADPHTIVAVNSGAGGGTQLLARIDQVYAWIQESLAEVAKEDAQPTPPPPEPPPGASCAHPICEWGAPLDAACDPCATKICEVDSYCCTTSWDKICVGEVKSVCGGGC